MSYMCGLIKNSIFGRVKKGVYINVHYRDTSDRDGNLRVASIVYIHICPRFARVNINSRVPRPCGCSAVWLGVVCTGLRGLGGVSVRGIFGYSENTIINSGLGGFLYRLAFPGLCQATKVNEV